MEQSIEMTNIIKTAIEDSMSYIDFLRGDNDNCSYNNLKTLQLMYAAIGITLWKDLYITKIDETTFNCGLIDDCVDTFINEIAKKIGDKYYIGNLVFDSGIHILDYIRNKLAHGDFIIDEDRIIIKKYITENKEKVLLGEGSIAIDDIIKLATKLGFNWKTNRKYGLNERCYTANFNKDCRYQSKNELKRALANIYCITISEKPKSILAMRNKEYIDKANEIINNLVAFSNTCKTYVELNTLLRMGKEYALQFDIDLEYKITRASELENINNIYSFFINNPSLKDKDNRYLAMTFTNLVSQFASGGLNKFDISKGLVINTMYLELLMNIEKLSLDDVLSTCEKRLKIVRQEHYKAILTSYLTTFYILYVYGLERIYTGKEEQTDTLMGLFDYSLFDFSTLDFGNIKPTVMNIEHEYKYFDTELKNMKKRTKDLYDEEASVREEYFNFIDNVNESYCKYQTVKDNYIEHLNDIATEREMLLIASQSLTEFMKNDFKDYRYKRELIEHIRNSIVHGNVFLDFANTMDDIEETRITFKDIHHKKLTFELSLTIKEFGEFFSQYNMEVLMRYLSFYNMRDKSKSLLKK